MARGYIPVDRDQQFLLPPNMRDWLPENHFVGFLLAVIERMDTSRLHARHPQEGVGRRAYDPDMLLAVLVYGYCAGVRSSRQIERLCQVDVAFRVLAANHVPDHTTIARFRQELDEVVRDLFVDVLELCRDAGLARVGVVAADGTKIAANASIKVNRTRSQLETEVKAMFEQAAAVDVDDDRAAAQGEDEQLPEELVDPRRRDARLQAALAALEQQKAARDAEQRRAREAARRAWEEAQNNTPEGKRASRKPPREIELEVAEAALADEQARAARRAAQRAEREAQAAAQGRKMRGPKPDHDNHRDLRNARERVAKARARAARDAEREHRVNVTDPDSRIMKTVGGWTQGYNAQAAVNEQGVALAGYVSVEGNDVGQCVPVMAAVTKNLKAANIAEPVGTMLFDAGYLSEQNLTAPGPDRLIATGKSHVLRNTEPAQGPPPQGLSPLEAMEHRLRTQDGKALYTKRQHTIEPVFGRIKHNLGFRRFSRRGLTAVDAEWTLQLLVHNLLKLNQHGPAIG